jgi:hypothetical protein
MKRIICLIISLLFAVACEGTPVTPTPTTTITLTATPEGTSTLIVTRSLAPAITFIPTKNLTPEPISAEAEAYLNEFLSIFLESTINRNELDPNEVRAEAFAHAAGAQIPEETYNTIRFILNKFGNRHSFFFVPTENTPTENVETPTPEGYLIDDKLAYIKPATCCSYPEQRGIYAEYIQQLLRDLDIQSPCGWILDLSRETGGDMWFAIAGLGPLMGEERLGAYLYPDSDMLYWYYRNGEAGIEGSPPLVTLENGGYRLRVPDAPVAILISRATASAGEGIAIAFRGRPNTRFFGQPTGGFTTANSVYEMSDGARLVLTEAYYVDRTGQIYSDKILPDETTYAGSLTDDVKNWLLSQPACDNP